MDATATIAPAPQHMRALERANEVRLARAELKRQVGSGKVAASDIVLGCPWEAHTMKLSELLMSQRRWGRTRCRKILQSIRLSENKTVGSLTERQRITLAAIVAEKAAAAEAAARIKAAQRGAKPKRAAKPKRTAKPKSVAKSSRNGKAARNGKVSKNWKGAPNRKVPRGARNGKVSRAEISSRNGTASRNGSGPSKGPAPTIDKIAGKAPAAKAAPKRKRSNDSRPAAGARKKLTTT